MTATRTMRLALAAMALLAGLLAASPASAALFEDTEARKAILEMRKRMDELYAVNQRNSEDMAQLRRSLLEMQNTIESQRQEIFALRGQLEQTQRSVGDVQNISRQVDERLRQFEPATVLVDGQEFQVQPQERAAFESALEAFSRNDYGGAQKAFAGFLKSWPDSGYRPSALYWLGNAQYATRDYKNAIGNLRALTTSAPSHMRAPEAALAIANCQIELRDIAAAKKALEDVIKAYPQSEAAATAKERLARLR